MNTAGIRRGFDYYPFGMLQPERQYDSGGGYRFGFNGKENDKEVKGNGAQYDYGFRIYDPRVSRFLSVDPLFKSYPWYTPYQFAGNKPIIAIDLDGLEEKLVVDLWAGVTYAYFEFDIGFGLGVGLNYTKQRGMAYDEVGKTKYSSKLTLYVSNQVKDALNKKTPNFVAGASISATVNVQQNWKHETYLGAIGALNTVMVPVPTGVSAPAPKNIKAADIVAVNASISSESVSLGIGVGFGIKIPIVNTELIESISLTDKEVTKVQLKADVLFEMQADWNVKNVQAQRNETGAIIGFNADLYTKDKKGKEVATGIKLYSGVVKTTSRHGDTQVSSDNIWRSSDYNDQAIEAEKNGGTEIKF